MRSLLPPAWFWPLAAGALGLHLVFAAVTIARSNPDLTASDQGAEIWMADAARQDLLPSRTDGVRHPLFSWIVRWVYVPDREAFFVRGKWFNTVLSMAFLGALGLATARRLGPLATLNLMLLASMGILVVRGTYFQPEPLYYALFTVCTVLGWGVLSGGGAWMLIAFGTASGLAFLAKPSLTPFLAAFILGLLVRTGAGLLLERRLPRIRLRSGLCALAGVAIFTGLVAPLGFFSAKYFGKPFFNYPQVWMWMDDFENEAWPWQDRHPGRAQLETLKPEDTPSPGWYFRRHDLGDALSRLIEGTREVGWRFVSPEPKKPLSAIFWKRTDPRHKWEQPLAHRGVFAALLAGLALILAALQWQRVLGALKTDPVIWGLAAYVVSALAAYTLLYGWYWPIGRGDRFMGSLWIPVILGLSLAGAFLKENRDAVKLYGKVIYTSFHSVVLILLCAQILSTSIYFFGGGGLTTRN